MHKRQHSAISEFTAWILFTFLAVFLAFPLSSSRYKDISWENFITLPSNALNFSNLTPPGNALKSAPLNDEVSSLKPSPDLLKTVSANTRPQPKFSAAAAKYDSMIERTAKQHQVSPVLVKAVIQAESNFNPSAVSNNGAVGLMQLLPSTARSMGVHDPMDPQKNITAGTKYLKMLLNLYNDDETLALAAYNAGPETLKRFNNQVPPFRETQAFVEKVMLYYHSHLDS
ncbi:lytic transglycosylase [Deltaproteobacteria bacterium Smac51]|nr:lytic transglycosylase [Deltaproteobacteria bacterium Smac51]